MKRAKTAERAERIRQDERIRSLFSIRLIIVDDDDNNVTSQFHINGADEVDVPKALRSLVDY